MSTDAAAASPPQTPVKTEPAVTMAEEGGNKGGRRRANSGGKKDGNHPFQMATPQRMGDSHMHSSELARGGQWLAATPNRPGERYSVELDQMYRTTDGGEPPLAHPESLPAKIPMWIHFLLFGVFMVMLLILVGGLVAGGSQSATPVVERNPLVNHTNGTYVVPYFASGDGSAGFFSAGTVSAGVFSVGSSLTLGIFSLGFVSVGFVSVGFCSCGVFSLGVFSVGIISSGHIVLGLWAWGTYSFYTKGGWSAIKVRRISEKAAYAALDQTDVEAQGGAEGGDEAASEEGGGQEGDDVLPQEKANPSD